MLKELDSLERLKEMPLKDMEKLAEEIRREIIDVVTERGGHMSSNLGMVELTLALLKVFDLPDDKLVYDVGHQAYVHKLLTGRYELFKRLRSKGGASGFPSISESEYDSFTAGHASTAISAALGMARARDIQGKQNQVVAVVGDGALTGGMCYEALNDAGQSGHRLIVVLNDNTMSISRNVGAMSAYLNNLRRSRTYRAIKRGIRRGLSKIPRIGFRMFHFLEKTRDMLKSLFIDGKFFEALGFTYVGPIDGHDLKHLIKVLDREKSSDGPVIIHVVTIKGHGYAPAEEHPVSYHGVAPYFSDIYTEETELKSSGEAAMEELIELARDDERICTVTAAMANGTGVALFQKAYPSRSFDVGIAEEHAAVMAAGLAAGGMKPYFAVYSTFAQRAFDQILIDICRNNLPVTLLLDRAGLVGSDGETHQGIFDLGYLRMMPGMTVAAPRDVRELQRMIRLSARMNGPIAIRYPKDIADMGERMETEGDIELGSWEVLSSGEDVMFLAVGRMVRQAMLVSIELNGKGIRAGVIDARFVKPMDEKLLEKAAKESKLLVTLEENILTGGFGEGVLKYLNSAGYNAEVMTIGVPDGFIPHATVSEQLDMCGLGVNSIAAKVQERIAVL